MSRTAPAPTPVAPAVTADWLLERTEVLCRADTSTGREDHGLPALRGLLRELGAAIELQEVAPGRHNVLATWGTPRLLFSTHLDCVPPFVPPRRQGDLLTGRGANDAKGQITAQLGAIRTLLQRGRSGFAWLGVVGEETDSCGALAALDLAPRLATCVALIAGEPTDNRLASGQRGAQLLRLSTRGVAAHSGLPERGRSALWPLLDWLQRIRELPTVTDATLGPEIWNLGHLHGGGAPNVIPADASAELFVRTVPGSQFFDQVRALAPAEGRVDELSYTPPERFPVVAGFPAAIVPFGSDAPRLRQLVKDHHVVLCGPGSITTAHTLDERITGAELLAGHDQLVALAEALLRDRG